MTRSDDSLDWTPRDQPLGAPAAPVPSPARIVESPTGRRMEWSAADGQLPNGWQEIGPASATALTSPQPYYSQQVFVQHVAMPRPPISAYAGAALGFSIAGVCFAFPAIVGVVLGHLALQDIEKANGGKGGRGMALASLWIGYAILGVATTYLITAVIEAYVG